MQQTQKEYKGRIVYTNQEMREYNKRKDEEYRNKRNDELDLLRKCIPGTKKLTRPQILKKAVNYIQQLLNPEESIMVEPQEMLPQTQKRDKRSERIYQNKK
jgi:hypothetical protein